LPFLPTSNRLAADDKNGDAVTFDGVTACLGAGILACTLGWTGTIFLVVVTTLFVVTTGLRVVTGVRVVVVVVFVVVVVDDAWLVAPGSSGGKT
jgi:hypothetical protein